MALLVVCWHAFLIVSFSIQSWFQQVRTESLNWAWILVDPQFLPRAIVVFFMLSGFVLTRSTRSIHFSWRSYYPSRLLRLYLPAWAALVFALVLIHAIPRDPGSVDTSWLSQTNATDPSWTEALWEGTLLSPRPTIDNPLWSISWEVLGSLLLPVLIFVSRAAGRFWLYLMGFALVACAVGDQFQIVSLIYLPTFLIGALAAVNFEKVMGFIARVNNSKFHTLWWAAVLVVSLACIIGYRITPSFNLVKPFTVINHALSAATTVGFLGILLLSIGARHAVSLLETRSAQWLGSISFSLYLVHVPILATLGFALAGRPLLAVAIGVPLAVVVGALFSRFVERPIHRFARTVGRRAAGVSRGPVDEVVPRIDPTRSA